MRWKNALFALSTRRKTSCNTWEVDLVVLWPDFFDLWKLCSLLVIVEGMFLCEVLSRRFIMVVRVPFDPDLIGITPFKERAFYP